MAVGATNFPQALDKALTRPGRFDKNIVVPLPDVKGRKDIIDLYLKKTVPAPDVDIVLLAKGTPGFSGAELANLINIAAIKATVQNKPHIDMKTLEEARDDVLVGIKRMGEHTKEDLLSTAYHEGGHALVGILTDGTKPIHKATIVGRGNALGITWSLQREGESLTKKQALAELAMAMGGRAAEEIIYGEESVTTGASNDIQTATYLATQMVSRWGMSDRVGKVYYDLSANTANTSGLKISEQELTVISSEIKDIVEVRRVIIRLSILYMLCFVERLCWWDMDMYIYIYMICILFLLWGEITHFYYSILLLFLFLSLSPSLSLSGTLPIC